jgi:hypothetical protein
MADAKPTATKAHLDFVKKHQDAERKAKLWLLIVGMVVIGSVYGAKRR